VSRPVRPRKDRSAWLWFAATALVFVPAMRGEFLNWDDTDWILNNPLVVIPGGEMWWSAWSDPFLGSWYPLYIWSLRALWGIGQAIEGFVQGDPQLSAVWTFVGGPTSPFHAASILLFASAAALWHECLRRLGVGPAGRALAVVWFALHPLRVESVVWATALRDVLSVTLLLGALYLHLSDRPGLRRVAAPAVFAAALLCKSMVFMLAPLPLLVDLLWRRRPWRESLAVAAPWLALGVADAVVARLAYQTVLDINTPLAGGLPGSLPVIAAIQARYLRLQLVPSGLAALPSAPDPGMWGWLLLVAGVAVVAGAAWWATRGHRRPLLVCLLYLLPMAPVCGLMPLAWAVADRYTLLPSLGLTLGLAALVDTPRLARFALPASGAVAALWAVLTILTIPHWHDSAAVWTRSLDLYPREWATHLNYAGVCGGEDRMEDARVHLWIARELVEGSPQDHAKVAEMLMFAELILASEPLDRMQSYRQSFAQAGQDPAAMAALALELAAAGQRSSAEVIVRHAEELGAGPEVAPLVRGILADREGDHARALYHAVRGLESAPGDVHLLTLQVRSWIMLAGPEAARPAAEALSVQLPGTEPEIILQRMSDGR
jgi:protein O-mannosyl-transferase